MRTRLTKLFVVAFLLLLLLDPAVSVAGARNGLLLWFQTLLPTLLPFVILSGLAVRLGAAARIARVAAPLLCRLLPIGKNGCYPVLIGFLSGMPVGAKAAADMVEDGSLSAQEAEYLLCVCGNASPMFLLGFVATDCLRQKSLGFPLLLLLYLSALLAARLYYRFFCVGAWGEQRSVAPAQTKASTDAKQPLFQKVDAAILDGFEVMTKVGGYLILFSVLVEWLTVAAGTSFAVALLSGVAEITTGIARVGAAEAPPYLRLCGAAVIAAFGGISGFAQTRSVTARAGLSMRPYLLAKLLQTGLVALVCALAAMLQ